MNKSLLLCFAAGIVSFAAPAGANAQGAQPAPPFAASVWDARLTPAVVTAGMGDPQAELSARWRRPVWVLPAAGAVVGGFAGLLYHIHLCSGETECSGPPVLVPVGAVAGAVLTAVLQKEIRRSRRSQPEARP